MSDFMNDERIMAWLDGELFSDEAAQLEAEIANNPALQADVEQLRSIKTAIQSLERKRAPRNFTLDANEYGTAPRERYSFFSRWAVPALALAAVTLIAAVLLTQFPLGGGEEAITVGDAADEIAEAVTSVAEESIPRENVTIEAQNEYVHLNTYLNSEEEAGFLVQEGSDGMTDEASTDGGGNDAASSSAVWESRAVTETVGVLDDNSVSDEVAQVNESPENSEETEEDADTEAIEAEVEPSPQPQPSLLPTLPTPPTPTVEPTPTAESIARRRIDWPTTFEIPTDTITATDGITGTNGLSGTVGDTSASSWGDALRDLTIGFLILLLLICIFVFGLGMWILLNRHQR